jgi:hypothetical protein
MTKTKNLPPQQLACPMCETEELVAFVAACENSRHGHAVFICSHCDNELGTLEITPASLREVLTQDEPEEAPLPRKRRLLN